VFPLTSGAICRPSESGHVVYSSGGQPHVTSITEQIQGTYFRLRFTVAIIGFLFPVILYFGGKMHHFGLRGSMSACYWATQNAPCPCGDDPDHAGKCKKIEKNSKEIGHYVMHVKTSMQSRLFIDRYVAFRDDESSAGNDGEEVEANAFGAALLMPARLVREEIKKHDLDLDDEDDLGALARKFNVSTSAMSYRLVNLGLLR
jgi:IrrE N-terminal-like domain